jgi:hypothetical protein
VPLPEEVANQYGLRGVVVQAVRPGSGAAQAGLRGIDEQGRLGDVIVGAEGKPVGSVADLAAQLERVEIGNRARPTIVRGDAHRRCRHHAGHQLRLEGASWDLNGPQLSALNTRRELHIRIAFRSLLSASEGGDGIIRAMGRCVRSGNAEPQRAADGCGANLLRP